MLCATITTGTSGWSAFARAIGRLRSSTSADHPLGPRWPGSSVAAREAPWPRWSWPYTAYPAEARASATWSYRRRCSPMPWTSTTTPATRTASGAQRYAASCLPSADRQENGSGIITAALEGSRSGTISAPIGFVEELLRSLHHGGVAAAQRVAPHRFDAQLVIQRAANDLEHRLLGRLDRRLIAAPDPLDHGVSLLHQLVVRHYAGHHVCCDRSLGRARLAGHQQLQCHADAAGVYQTRNAAVSRMHSATYLEGPELCKLGGDPDVARHCQLDAVADAPAVDRGDDGLGNARQRSSGDPAETVLKTFAAA